MSSVTRDYIWLNKIMRRTPLIIIVGLIAFTPLFADGPKQTEEDVVVEVFDKAMPMLYGKEKFLWDNFTGIDNEKFDLYTAENWKQNYSHFSKSLIKKAGEKKLDEVSLQKVLDLVLKHSDDKIAYLPIGAYQTTYWGKPIWIIVVKWEYPTMGTDGLGHIRVFAYDQKTLELVAFSTCM